METWNRSEIFWRTPKTKKNRVSKSGDDRETRGMFRISTTEVYGEFSVRVVQNQNRNLFGRHFKEQDSLRPQKSTNHKHFVAAHSIDHSQRIMSRHRLPVFFIEIPIYSDIVIVSIRLPNGDEEN
jgi:hypothetical protein